MVDRKVLAINFTQERHKLVGFRAGQVSLYVARALQEYKTSLKGSLETQYPVRLIASYKDSRFLNYITLQYELSCDY